MQICIYLLLYIIYNIDSRFSHFPFNAFIFVLIHISIMSWSSLNNTDLILCIVRRIFGKPKISAFLML